MGRGVCNNRSLLHLRPWLQIRHYPASPNRPFSPSNPPTTCPSLSRDPPTPFSPPPSPPPSPSPNPTSPAQPPSPRAHAHKQTTSAGPAITPPSAPRIPPLSACASRRGGISPGY